MVSPRKHCQIYLCSDSVYKEWEALRLNSGLGTSTNSCGSPLNFKLTTSAESD